jgi:phage FluMu protein Com
LRTENRPCEDCGDVVSGVNVDAQMTVRCPDCIANLSAGSKY